MRTLIIISLAVCLASPPLAARDRDRQRHQATRQEQGYGIDADQAAAIARHASGGRVLSLKPVERRQGPAYRAKVLHDGRVRLLYIDARDGHLQRR